MARTPLNRCLLLVVSVLGMASTVQAAGMRERLRERLAERAELQAGPAQPTTLLAANAAFSSPGRYEIRLQHDGIERRALVHIPRSYNVSNAMPLVMALHGGGGGMIHMASDQNYGLITKSEQAGFIAVFPNGVSKTTNGMLATWNAGNCCAQARDDNVDDVGFLRKLVEDVSRRTRIDRQRVFAIGMSNGAMMSYRLACEAPEVFRAIMAVAGTDNTTRCTPRAPVPVLHVHARNDDRVLFDGGAGSAQRRQSLVTHYVSVSATIDKWAKLNHANSPARRVLTTDGAHCDLHEAQENGAPVQLCVTESGGHSWPGGQKLRGSEPPSQAIRANEVMWDFFSRAVPTRAGAAIQAP